MEYRVLGRTGLNVSAVGFGTAQLRRVGETQAIDTLLRGFDLGVNIVHTAPDYEGAEDLVAAAVARTNRKVIVASNGYDIQYNRTGRVRLFEKLFETTCRKLKTDRLDLFGIASVDDREAFGENVWGTGGMVEFLQRMKAKGRLGATFCTTHGKPEFTKKLIESGAFDAVMVSYNDLGFHMLTLNPPANWQFEDVRRTKSELFPLCEQRGVGLMIMLPFGGGLILRSKAFPPDNGVPAADPPVSGSDVLRSILAHPEVSTVLPGTACVEEAEENALAGHAPVEIKPDARQMLERRLKVLETSLCSRCGACEPLCSQHLQVSWMFRAGYMSTVATSPYETWEDVEYFKLHPDVTSTCATCPNVTCVCPAGIDIPQVLTALHEKMVEQMRRGLVPPPVADRPEPVGNRLFGARVVRRELPSEMRPGQKYVCRLNVENRGLRRWHARAALHHRSVRLKVLLNGRAVAAPAVRHTVHPGNRCHFVFDLTAPAGCDRAKVELKLVSRHPLIPDLGGVVLFSDEIPIREDA
jgi:predicted aldo/keto reductase-like oxidoreductase